MVLCAQWVQRFWADARIYTKIYTLSYYRKAITFLTVLEHKTTSNFPLCYSLFVINTQNGLQARCLYLSAATIEQHRKKIAITQIGHEEFIQPVQIICRIYFIFERKWYFLRFLMKFCCCYCCCFRIVQWSSPNKLYFFKYFPFVFLWCVKCHWPFLYFVR